MPFGLPTVSTLAMAAGIRKRSDRCLGAVCNDLQRHGAVIGHALHQIVGRAIGDDRGRC